MYFELKENKAHGTKDFPYVDYYMKAINHPFQIPVHWHDEIEIVFVKSGPFKLIIEGHEYDSKAGDIFVINPGELHLMGSTESGADYHTFVFPLEFVSFKTEDFLEEEFFGPLRMGTKKLQNKIQVNDCYLEMKKCLEKAIELYKNETLVKQFGIRIELLKFFELLFRTDTLTTINDEKTTLGREILTFIQQHYTEDIKLSDIAGAMHLSDKYVSRYFKQTFRLNISQYVSHLRVSHAKHLLETSTAPITEIAYQSGFQDVSYFVRSFHRMVGVSPLQYRKGK